MTTTASPVTLTVAEAAQALRVHANTVRRAIARGDFPAVRVGRRVLIPMDALVDLLNGEKVA